MDVVGAFVVDIAALLATIKNSGSEYEE